MKKNKVRFVVKNPGMLEYDVAIPQPASKFAPSWFSDIPNYRIENQTSIIKTATAKSCPSFLDTFKEGYVIPAPCDIYFMVDAGGAWRWRTNSEWVTAEIHSNDILVDYMPKSSNVRQVFKLVLPFSVHTSKGIWMRQVPMFWEYNKDFHVAYGQMNTNKIHEVNIQVLYTSDKNEIIIKQGTPLCTYVPFRKEKFDTKLIETNSKIERAEAVYKFGVTSKFKGGYYHNVRD